MRFSVLTLFPELVECYFRTSITARSVRHGLIECQVVDIRNFAAGSYRSCDDSPYGGGAGMVMKAEPLSAALASLEKGGLVVLPTPIGQPLSHDRAAKLSGTEHLVLIAGRYEGIDQRFIDRYVDLEISLGDYVLASGELAAMVIIDAVARLRPGVIRAESLHEESFTDGLLEYPHYTRPEVFEGLKVPKVLLSGNHREIADWRLKERLRRTARRRENLLQAKNLDARAKRLLAELKQEGEVDATDYPSD